MMKLSTMHAVDRTVNTHGESPIAAQILKQWEHDHGSVKFFRTSANFVYLFHKEGEPFFLRFAESSERTSETIKAEIDILQWLTVRGMTVTPPIKSRKGNFVETVVTDLGTFHAVVFSKLEGSHLEIENLDEYHFGEWGGALGKLHSTLENYAPSDVSARSSWRDHLELTRAFLLEGESAVRSEFEQIASSLEALFVTHDSYGLIHGDFELDNLYWQGNTIGIGDFDECSYAWYIMDIAFALRDLFHDRIDLNNRLFLAFIRGYRVQRALPDECVSQLPLFLRMARLFTYTRLVRSMDLPPHGEDPVWLQALRLKLENRRKDYKASLENHS